MRVIRIPVGPMQANCYICLGQETQHALLIDPGDEPQRLLAQLAEHQAQLDWIVLTHFHFDHVTAAEPLRAATGAPIAIHTLDAPLLANPPALMQMLAGSQLAGITADRLLDDNAQLTYGQQTLQVIATPGHSPGGICLYNPAENILFSGDTLFRASIGRTDFPGCDQNLLLQAIRERLFTLPDLTRVYPGHGASTTIAYEKQHNPYISG